MFLIFLLHIVYNNTYYYKDLNNIVNFNYQIYLSSIFQFFKVDCIFINNFNILKINLDNFIFNTDYNTFFYKVNTYINNIIVNENIYIYYDVDNILYLFLYKFNFIFYFLIYLVLLII